MSVGKLAIATILMIFAGLVLSGCEGDDGPPGPPGLTGPEGPSGDNRSIPVPDNRTFAIQVGNSTSSDSRWAGDLVLTFDVGATPSASQVVGALLEEAPIIDGVDDGAGEWGTAAASEISLAQVIGADNGIGSASVRFGYDLDYVYMQVVWTEVATGDFVAAPDTTRDMWIRGESSWSQDGGEDQLWIGWDDAAASVAMSDKSPIKQSSLQSGDVSDIWLWQSTVTGYEPHLRDLAVWVDDPETIYYDSGFDFITPNDAGAVPDQMQKNSRPSGSAYPLRAFEATNYDAGIGWQEGAMIPGFVFFEPAGSLADVEAMAKFDNGVWTLEMRRYRNSGNSDDSVF